MAINKTWLCSICGASTVRDDKILCPSCQEDGLMLWNVVDSTQIIKSPYVFGPLDWPVARWLEDRAEKRCFLCEGVLEDFLPQGFVSIVLKAGVPFPVGAACENCAPEPDLEKLPIIKDQLPEVLI